MPYPRRAIVAASLLLGACTATQPLDPPPAAEPGSADGGASPSSATASPRPVAIVISSDAAAYQGIARALFVHEGYDFTKYSLDNASGPVIAELIDRQAIEDVIVVGEEAARSIRPSSGLNVYYSQVYAEAALQADGYAGVSAVPPFTLQLSHWRQSEPNLRVVGAIGSPEMALFADELAAAAAELGMTLRYEQVESDKEALFVFKRMVPEIDGYLFLPDARVLSPPIIRNIVAYGSSHGLSMLTYSRAIAALGATVHITTDEADVADRLVNLLNSNAEVRRLRPTRLGDSMLFHVAADAP